MNKRDREKLSQVLQLLGEQQISAHLKKFDEYIDLLRRWNRKTNLISRSDESNVLEHHIIESLSVLFALDFPDQAKLLDIGTGAGFPGIPISIIKPDVSMFLLESKRMKVLFLKEAIERLKLKNTHAILQRAEELATNQHYANAFDVVLTRAVGSLAKIFSWAEPLLKKSGVFIAWKGGDISGEISELKNNFKGVSIEIKKMDVRMVDSKRNKFFVILTR